MAVKYYAVRKGIKPGIYKDWNTCKASDNMGCPILLGFIEFTVVYD